MYNRKKGTARASCRRGSSLTFGMKRRVWLRIESLAAKVAWVEEAASGLCIGPSVWLPGVHYSYHDTGRRHLTFAARRHHTFRPENDARLNVVAEHRNVGGFGIDAKELRWIERSSFSERDLILDCDPRIRRDLGVMISLQVSARAHQVEFRERIRSLGATCRDATVTFELGFFPHLVGIVQVQYHTTA
jgi:hypothetical protein